VLRMFSTSLDRGATTSIVGSRCRPLTLEGHRASINVRGHLSTSGRSDGILNVCGAQDTASLLLETAALKSGLVALLDLFS
jgi:hypothetical protein